MRGPELAGFLAQKPGHAKPLGAAVLEARFPRTLDRLVGQLLAAAPGTLAEAWLFEDEAARRGAEARLAQAGIRARFRSAYKPLVHACLEEFALSDLRRMTVTYPVEPQADPLRFRLEAYPLAAMIEGVEPIFRPGGAGLTYRVELLCGDGRTVRHRVFAPNRVRGDPSGAPCLAPCGWLRVRGGDAAMDGPIRTETEAAFDAVLAAVESCPVEDGPSLLERLLIEIACPGIERRLTESGEAMSLAEALHEDVYFSAHETLARRCGQAMADRGFRPGQVIPVIGQRLGEARVRVALAAHEQETEPPGWAGPLDRTESAPSLRQIADELGRLGGESFEAWSVQGRAASGTVLAGDGPAVLVTAGQHGNETSGVVGALRAAERLLGRAHLALIPVENPDGYALHGQLCRDQPHHIHHAARLTALGDDVEARAGPPWEAAARGEALRRTGALLHVNLHGYPAHEWTRPFTGYVPRGFAAWTMPKGFFLILRHHPGWAARARALLDRVTARLAEVPGLLAFNEGQIALALAHGGQPVGAPRHGIHGLLEESPRGATPLTLITEFPDETLTGEPFIFAHEVQMQAVLAAVVAWQEIARAS